MSLWTSLTTELQNLIAESKRKQVELRQTSERSFDKLQRLRDRSDTSVVNAIQADKDILSPLLLTCKLHFVKHCSSAIALLQRLATIKAIPVASLGAVLNALVEGSNLGLDTQLRVLQTLPVLFSSYTSFIERDHLREALGLCFSLIENKSSLINNTAAATVRQLLILSFDRADKDFQTGETGTEGNALKSTQDVCDAFRDICLLSDGQQPQYLTISSGISPTISLELVESVLTSHSELCNRSTFLMDNIKQYLVPLLSKALSQKLGFPLLIRISRLVFLLIQNHVEALSSEAEVLIALLTYTVQSDISYWRRCVFLEVYRTICTSDGLIERIYAEFDARSERKNLVEDLLAAFNRLLKQNLSSASSLGQNQSEKQPRGEDTLVVEAGNAVSGFVNSEAPATQPVVSSSSSSLRIPLLEQLDKSEAPTVPGTYAFLLILTTFNGLADNLRVSLRNKSLHSDELSDKEPSRTSDDALLQSGNRYQKLQQIMSTLWPAFLSCYSVFFSSSLENDLLKLTIRSYSSLLEVAMRSNESTARRALFNHLCRCCSPLEHPSGVTSPKRGRNFAPNGSFMSVDSVIQTAQQLSGLSASNKSRVDGEAELYKRVLMLRALMCLAKDTGDYFLDSWDVFCVTLVEDLLEFRERYSDSAHQRKGSSGLGQRNDRQSQARESNLWRAEFRALDPLERELYSAISALPPTSFAQASLAFIVVAKHPKASFIVEDAKTETYASEHTRSPSVGSEEDSGILTPVSNTKSLSFVIEALCQICTADCSRFVYDGSKDRSWSFISAFLGCVIQDQQTDNEQRLAACNCLCSVLVAFASHASKDSSRVAKGLGDTLLQSVSLTSLAAVNRSGEVKYKSINIDICGKGLGCLHNLLEIVGELVLQGWRYAFDMLSSTCDLPADHTQPDKEKLSKLIGQAFSCLKLLCSDFLTSLSPADFVELLEVLSIFCQQNVNTNIALTSVGLFWDVLDGLRRYLSNEKVDITEESLDQIRNQVSNIKDSGDLKCSDSLWVLTLGRLSGLAAVSRRDVSEPAIRIIFRTMETQGSYLSSSVLGLCLRLIIEPLLRDCNVDKSEEGAETAEMGYSTEPLSDALSAIFSQYSAKISSTRQFVPFWNTLLSFMAKFGKSEMPGSIKLVNAFGACIWGLSESADPHVLETIQGSTWLVVEGLSSEALSANTSTSQEYFDAYLKCLQKLCIFLPVITDRQQESIREIAQRTVEYRASPHYALDVDVLSQPQKSALDLLYTLNDRSNFEVQLIAVLSNIAVLAVPVNEEQISVKAPTFVAICKECMKRVIPLVTSPKVCATTINDAGHLAQMIDNMSRPIWSKFRCPAPSRIHDEPPLWILATEVVLCAIGNWQRLGLEQLSQQHNEQHQCTVQALLRMIQGISSNQIECDENNKQSLVMYESFDTDAFEAIRGLFLRELKLLPNGQVKNDLMQDYIKHLSGNCRLYYRPGDCELLEKIWSSTERPRACARRRLAVLLYGRLFDTVDRQKEGYWPEMAAIARPVIMCRLSNIFASLEAHQRLLGMMPMPYIQREEIVLCCQFLRRKQTDIRTNENGYGNLIELMLRLITSSGKEISGPISEALRSELSS